jgi:alpha-maltose-1-phosphate synthase
MRILLLCEGDAETWDSWSGSARSLLDHLRLAGHTVETRDVDLAGADRWMAAAGTFSPRRRRWWSKYHLAEGPFRRRSRLAGRHVEEFRDRIDLVLQIGATFEPLGCGPTPYAVYCDSNIRVAELGAATGHSDAFTLTPAELEGVRAREGRVYRGAAAVFAMSDFLRRSFRDDFQIPAERVFTLHAGLNLDLERIPWPRPARSAGPPTILFVGRQFERKGGDLLLRAFRRVRERVPGARLLIVGPASLERAEEGVHVLGFLDKGTAHGWNALMRAYAESDVFCLPTRFEPFGIAYLEAMFFGLPCIGTDRWAVPEMVVEGETGYLVPIDDVEALADRLARLLLDPDLRSRMGVAGRARAESHFTWAAVVERMADALGAPRSSGVA